MTGAAQALLKTTSNYGKLLNHFGRNKSLNRIKQLHARAIISNSFSITHMTSHFTASYALCGYISHAQILFDNLPQKNLFLYNTIIRMSVQNGLLINGLKLFVEMVRGGEFLPDNFTYPLVFKACGELLWLDFGGVVHGRLVKDGFEFGTFVKNALMAMYMNFKEKEMASLVFEETWEKSTVSWNTMISGLFRNGCPDEALMVFDRMMVDSGVEPDFATMVSFLPVCGLLNDLETGIKVHRMIEEKALGSKVEVKNALVDMYVKCGSLIEARRVFDEIDRKDVVTWTSLINGYLLNGDARNALLLGSTMQFERVKPNSITIGSLLPACACLELLEHGQTLHCWSIRHQVESELIVETGLIDMYSKCKRVDFSFRVFSNTSKKRTSPWNAMLAGYTNNKMAREAMVLFKLMVMEKIDRDDATLNGVLPAYAILADLRQGMNIHGFLIRSGFVSRVDVCTSLVDIYSKCGNLNSAHKIFNEIPEKNKDIICWSAILSGYAMHGDGLAAISLFHQMVLAGVEPNEVTFTSALHACSHAGLVDEGLTLFKYMINHNKTLCRTSHYTCMVDLLGRAARLEEAYDLIRTMPFTPNHAVWGALLGACAIHEKVELGEVAAKSLFVLEPENTGNYVLMANLYAAAGRWEDAENIRQTLDEIGLCKAPAHSFIESRTV